MKKVFVIIMLVLLVLGAVIYTDYFISKTKHILPKLVIKQKLNDNSLVYNGVLYRVWYCKTNDTYTYASYFDKDAICQSEYVYENDFYTNELGVKISKKELQLLLTDGIYTQEMIENIDSKESLENAIHISYEYGRKDFILAEDSEGLELKSSTGERLIAFPEFMLVNDEYKWVSEINDDTKLYCYKKDGSKKYYATYENETCAEFKELKMDKKWCESYKNTMLALEETSIKKLCEE